MRTLSSMDVILYLLFINVAGILSTTNFTDNCGKHEKYLLEHGCSCGFYGASCSASYLNLEGLGIPFLDLLTGNFSRIESIDLSANVENLTIRYGLFTPFVQLRNLRIHNCNVVDIETGAFRGLTNLEKLEISGNSLLTFDSITNGLSQLNSPKLEVLNVSGNHNAENLSGGVIRMQLFQYLSESPIKVLDLSWTRLISLLAPFTLLPNLEKLNVSGTFLIGTTNCLSTLLTLRNLSHLVIDHWPVFPRGYDSIRNSEEPHGLYRRNTQSQCKSVPYVSDKGCLKLGNSVRTIQARYIDMDSLFVEFSKDSCFTETDSLYNLIISKNKISKQLGALYGLNKLKLLDISRPEVLFDGPLIKPYMFTMMPDLKTLRLAGFYLNRLSYEHIEKLFSQNHNLCELDISQNNLVNIPKKMFSKNVYLKNLNVSGNRLIAFDADLSACAHLESLDLRNNQLKHLDSSVIENISNLGTDLNLYLSGNELQCNCRLLRLIESSNISTTPFLCSYRDEERLISRNVSDEFVVDVCNNQSVPSHAPVLLGAVIGTLLVVVVIGVVVFVIFRRRKAAVCKSKSTNQPILPVVLSLKDCEIVNENKQRNPKFIVFLAYCSKDYQFVISKIYDKLNKKLERCMPQIDPNQLIIVYDKNFLAGIDIDEICRVAIIESHVTVAVVTEHFLESPWCNLEVKMALSSKVPLLPLFISKCETEKLTGFLRVVYDEKVRLLWPETSHLDKKLAEAKEDKLLDTLCMHIMTYVKLHQQQKECS